MTSNKQHFALRAAAFLLPLALSAAVAAVMVTGCGNMLIDDTPKPRKIGILPYFTIVGADHYRGPAVLTFYNGPTAAARTETGTLKVRITISGELEYESWRKVPPGWIKSLTLTRERLTLPAGKETILIGREINYTPLFPSPQIQLQLDKDGVLSHQTGGSIPIHSYAELQLIGDSPASLGHPSGGGSSPRYDQMGDIDLMGGMAGVPDWKPLGINPLTPFNAHYNGQRMTIFNLKINRPIENGMGLFGTVGSGASISLLKIDSGSVIGNYMVGSIAGQNNGSITNCSSTGVTVEGQGGVGGLVGIMTDNTSATPAAIKGSFYKGTASPGIDVRGVTITAEVGGIVGKIAGFSASGYSALSSCWAEGALAGGTVGGIAGLVNDNSITIKGCYFNGSLTGTTYNGGVAGTNYGTIGDCVYINTAAAAVGSIVGGTVSYTGSYTPTFSNSNGGDFPDMSGKPGWEDGTGASGQFWKTSPGVGGSQFPQLQIQ